MVVTNVLWLWLQLMVPPRDPKTLSKLTKAKKPDTAGKNWFDLPAQVRATGQWLYLCALVPTRCCIKRLHLLLLQLQQLPSSRSTAGQVW